MNNEILQRLRSTPGNNYCVDCKEPNPDWGSINLGIFMCINCSGVHRNLGTHISQVRSITLDTDCWQEKLVSFMCSVGNRAFNRIWEANISKAGGIRPQEHPDKSAVRVRFIMRKYRDKAFMNFNLGCIPDPLPLLKNDAMLETLESLPNSQANNVPSNPIDPSEVFKAGMLFKYGGKDNSFFHRWQKRWVTITKDGRLFYSKSHDTPPIDEIPIQYLPVLEPDDEVKYKFSISTPVNCRHEGRKFLFHGENDNELLDFVEALRKFIPSTVDSLDEFNHVEESFGSSSMITPLEDVIDSFTRSFFRWYQNLQYNPNPSQTNEDVSLSSLQINRSAGSTSPISSPSPLYRPINLIVKEGLLLYRSIVTSSWWLKYCVLTDEAFYISSYNSPPVARLNSGDSTQSPPSSPIINHRSSATQSHSVIVIPLSILYLDKNQPDYSNETNGPQAAFAVWSPLSYGLLGVSESKVKDDWISAIEASKKN